MCFNTSWQFGIPSVLKYMKKKTVMVKSTKVLEFVPSPAVTIIPPWKVEFKSGVSNIGIQASTICEMICSTCQHHRKTYMGQNTVLLHVRGGSKIFFFFD